MEKDKKNHFRTLIESLNDLNYIEPDDIPNIELYMDQVTTFMDENLNSSKRYSDDKLLTKTMINNYTKNKLIPPPLKKKYSKDHMILLIFIYYFKNILSINDIRRLFDPLTERTFGEEAEYKLEDIYKVIVDLEKDQTDNLFKDMMAKLKKTEERYTDIENPQDKEFLVLFSFISVLCFDVYIRKHIIEKIIDYIDE